MNISWLQLPSGVLCWVLVFWVGLPALNNIGHCSSAGAVWLIDWFDWLHHSTLKLVSNGPTMRDYVIYLSTWPIRQPHKSWGYTNRSTCALLPSHWGGVPYHAEAPSYRPRPVFLTSYPFEAFWLVHIEGLKLPNKPSALHKIRCHRGIAWYCQYILIT